VNIPAISSEDMEVLGPFLPLAGRLGRLAAALAEGPGIDRVEVECFGRIAERDTRLLTLSVLRGVLTGHTEEDVNLVNAPSLAEERGIHVSERTDTTARDFTDLLRVSVVSGGERARVAGTTLGRLHRPHLLEAWGHRFNLQLEEGAHLAVFRYFDLPGMMGRVGTVFGRQGVNISSAAVGRQAPGEDGKRDEVAVMVIATDGPAPPELVDEIVASDGFIAGRSLSL
jgi:D-3-phosphoglycerate dehydrogenase